MQYSLNIIDYILVQYQYFWPNNILFQQRAHMIKNIVCLKHNMPLSHICTTWNCSQQITVCQICQISHEKHKQRLAPIDKYCQVMSGLLDEQKKKQMQLLQSIDNYNSYYKQKKNQHKVRSEAIIQLIGNFLIKQKAQIVKKIKNQNQKQNQNIVNYFNLMNNKNLISLRIMFSSQKGLQSYYQDYKKYCSIKNVKFHIKNNLFTQNRQTPKALQQKVKKALAGSVTENFLNLIKLKVSKKDAMKLSSIVGVITQSVALKPNAAGKLPPPSPTKKSRKSRKTETFIN